MGVERKNLRQIAGEGFRRWFSDEYFDLIVWYEGEAQADSAMTLSTQARSRVNFNMSPVLEAGGELPEGVLERFRSNSLEVGL